MKLKPGDRVRIKRDIWRGHRDHDGQAWCFIYALYGQEGLVLGLFKSYNGGSSRWNVQVKIDDCDYTHTFRLTSVEKI